MRYINLRLLTYLLTSGRKTVKRRNAASSARGTTVTQRVVIATDDDWRHCHSHGVTAGPFLAHGSV